MRALVGITPCLDDRGRWRPQRDYVYADLAYQRAVEAAGGQAILLPPQADAEALLERVDAILLPGGDDFLPPTPYPPSVHFDETPATQLDFDGALLEGASLRGQPILGICYGMQRLALQRGGSLHFHLPIDLPDAAAHKLPEPDGRHRLEITTGSRLETLFDAAAASVNSIHHQAVREPGRGLRVSARAPDGVIEAIEGDAGFCIGVQWHPERLNDAASKALFRAFVTAAENYAASK